jgi:hypothetical protein
MLNLLRDIGLSFCPASVRTVHRPHSSLSVVRAAIITGALQIFVCSRWFLSGFMAFLSLRSQQYGSALQHQNESTQGWFAMVFFFEYLMFHPLALLLFYLAFEGFIRFVGGLCVSEVVPSLPVVLAFTIKTYAEHKKTQTELHVLASIPDSFEVLADDERLRIAASRAKLTWNATLTIGVGGEWYEVEREEKGTPPREYVYILKRAPVGKILRAYEEYDLAVTVKRQ